MTAALTATERAALLELAAEMVECGTSGSGKPSDPLEFAVAAQEEQLLGLAQLIGELEAERVELLARPKVYSLDMAPRAVAGIKAMRDALGEALDMAEAGVHAAGVLEPQYAARIAELRKLHVL